MDQMQQVQPQTPAVQPEPQVSNGYKLSVVIVVAILTLIFGGAGGYLLGKLQSKPSNDIRLTTQQLPTPTEMNYPTETATIQPNTQNASNLPVDWTYQQSNLCNVKFPLPPKKAPYYSEYNPNRQPSVTDDEGSGRFWQFEEYEASMFLFNTTSRIVFRAPEEASGYVSGDVEVICTPNTTGYTTQTLITKLESDLSVNDGSAESVTIKSKRNGTMWGQNIIIVKFRGGMFDDSDHYIFATSKNLYLVRKIAMSQNQTVKDTAEKILTNLQFVTN